jgi:hypothetical protein
MNSFEQIKALLELKEKGAISDAEFKKMLDILEAESKKEENAGVRSENLEESDDAEELGVRQKETEQKIRTQAEQTTREIRELVQLGKIEEALILFTSFDRKDLFDPRMSQLLNEKKAELEQRNRAKSEVNRDQELIEQLYEAYRRKDLSTAQIKFDQIKNKDVISTSIKKDLADFEKKNANEARVEDDRRRLIKEQNKKRTNFRNYTIYSVLFLLIVGGVYSFLTKTPGYLYLSNVETSKDVDSVNKKDTDTTKTTPIDDNAGEDNGGQGDEPEDNDTLKSSFLNHKNISSMNIEGFKTPFGIVFIQYSEKGDYRKAATEPELKKPESIIKDANLIKLLNERFDLNIAVPGGKQPEQKPNPKPKPEQRQPQQPQSQSQPRQEQYTSSELLEFPEKYVTEAERLKQKIKDPAVSLEEKNLAADHIITIRKEYESNVNKKWKENPQVQRILTDCIKVALKY